MTKNQFWKGSTFFVLFSFDLTLEYFWDRKERIDKEIKGERDETGDKEYRSTDYIRLLGLVKHPETDQLSLVRHIFIRRATFWLCGRL